METPTNKSTEFDSMLGRLVVEQGLATAQDVQDCVNLQRELTADDEDAKQRSLADLLVSSGIVTQRQITRLKPLVEEQKPTQQLPGFQILAKLGAGAMATVFKAKQISLDRTVAIKVLPQRFSNNKDFVERFYAEGRAAAKLNHPNIVGAYDVGQSGEYHYFVMEYVEGRTVFDDLQKDGKYSEDSALEIIIQIARALEHAHKAGFIHRDVKPKNIMLTKDGSAKLADMGLARAVSDREAAEAEQGKAYGTPYYIAPEQIRGDINIDFRCDIYGLGATFYHMVTGQVPFDGPNPSAVMHKHLKNALTPPDHINPSLSSGIGEIIEVCMAKDPASRYATTSDLLTDLEAVARGEPPLQARRKFDIGSLEALEKPTAAAGDTQTMPADHEGVPLFEQPMFWVAVAGWAVALVMLVILIVR
ncbi:MAG: protein kinase [Phycisphaera sp.]|nr:protein kinase [Phycisphaera sp.]